MKISSIHSLQTSTTSHKLLESVRSLRPLLCEALRASGCDTININEQEPVLHGEGVQNEDVQYLNSHASGQHVKEQLANLHAISSYGGDHDVNAEYHDHILHVDPEVQHRHPEPQSHNSANVQHYRDADVADVQHYHDAHHHGHGKEFEHYYDVYPCKEFAHRCDALHHDGYGHHGEGHLHHRHPHHHHHHGHGHEDGHNSNSMIVSTNNLPRITDYRSELPGVQEKIVQNSFWHSFHMTRESFVNVPLSCPQYPPAYHNRHLQQQYISSETMAFLNTVLLEAPASLYEGSISSEALLEAEASNKSNSNNECIQAQESMKNVQDFAGHQANCRELPPLLKSRKRRKRLPKTMVKQLEFSGESEGTDNEEGGKLLSPEGILTADLFSERRRNEELHALRSLVPTVSKLDVLVVDMEQKTYHLCICCEREGLLKLIKALEALNFDMISANIAVMNENRILYTVVVKVDTVEVLTPEMLKESILRSAMRFHLGSHPRES